MPVDVEKLRQLSPNVRTFMEFESEVESAIQQEDADRRYEIEDEKRAREKKARRKRLKKMRQTQGD